MPVIHTNRRGTKYYPHTGPKRGSVEDWIPISPPGALPELARKHFKHLGKDSMYDLY